MCLTLKARSGTDHRVSVPGDETLYPAVDGQEQVLDAALSVGSRIGMFLVDTLCPGKPGDEPGNCASLFCSMYHVILDTKGKCECKKQ